MTNSKTVIAVLVLVFSFGLLAFSMYLGNGKPDEVVASIASGAIVGVVGFFFGHQNGTQTALASSAVQLAQQAIEKRGATLVPVGTLAIAQAPPGPPTPASG